MRFLFVYPGIVWGEVPLGMLYISACLKREGHDTAYFDLDGYGKEYFSGELVHAKDKAAQAVREFNPDIIGFYACSTEMNVSMQLVGAMKDSMRDAAKDTVKDAAENTAKDTTKNTTDAAKDVPIIFGGPHPTIDPEGTLKKEGVDYVCIGEGEEAIVELVNAMRDGADTTAIKSIWAKTKDGTIHKNQIRPLLQDLDSLPYPDREIIPEKYLHHGFGGASFITSRGCPYHCTYCINDFLINMYKGMGHYTRYRDVKLCIDEIKGVVAKYKIKRVTFSDETLTMNKKRLLEFLALYKKEVNLPFLCQTRANTVDDEIFAALKDANCYLVSMGVEAGADRIRNEVLNRKMSRETIENAFALAKKHGIKTGSFNMVGLPYETEADIWETIDLNKKIKPDLLHSTIFMPFEGTKLGELCKEQGWIKKEINKSYYSDMVHVLPTIPANRVMMYGQLFTLYVKLDYHKHVLLKPFELILLTVKNKAILKVVFKIIDGINLVVKKESV